MIIQALIVYVIFVVYPYTCFEAAWTISFRDHVATEKFEVSLSQLRFDAQKIDFLRQNYQVEESVVGSLFKRFAVLFERPYLSSDAEYARRQQYFRQSLRRQARLNKEENGNSEHVYGINKFSDWSEEEFKGLLKGGQTLKENKEFMKSARILDFHAEDGKGNGGCTYRVVEPPKAVDWRKEKKITPVKNQGNCGSCWAFVAAQQTETFWAISGRPLEELSVQEFISCAPSLGCNGGNTCQALAWLATALYNETNYRLVKASEYPYEAKETPCKYGKTTMTGATILGICGCGSMVGHEHVMLQVLAQKGPLGVSVNSILWHDYIGGIIQRHCTNQTINHAVQIVGYDLSGPVPYYIVKNTWGPDFGEDGYLRIKYGGNLCGLAQEPSFIYV